MSRPSDTSTADTGSLALELVVVLPVLMLLLALVYGFGQVSQLRGTLEAGTRDAARSASQARTADDAEQVATSAVLSSVGAGSACGASLDVHLVGAFAAGTPVTVRATCTSPLGDLGLPGLPGDVTTSSVFSSPVDPDRGLTPRAAP